MRSNTPGREHRWRGASITWITTGLTALGAFLSTESDAALHVPLLILALFSFMGATICMAAYVHTVARASLADRREAREYEYRQTIGSATHLREVVALGKRSIGDAHVDIATLRERLKVNSQVLRVVMRQRQSRNPDICGYTLLYPLTEDAAARILREEVRAGSEIPGTCFCPDVESASCLYIGMILGTDREARAHVKGVLKTELVYMLSSSPNIRHVFGRPATPQGRQLLERYHFIPVADEDDIWMARAPELQHRLRADLAYAA